MNDLEYCNENNEEEYDLTLQNKLFLEQKRNKNKSHELQNYFKCQHLG